jgi:hypothetical protein
MHRRWRQAARWLVLGLWIGTADGIGTQFLVLPSTARELALGINPVLAVTPTANPALMVTMGRTPQLELSYGTWLAGVRFTTVGVGYPLGSGVGGVRLRSAGLNDLELRTWTPTDEPLSSYGATGLALDFLYAGRFGSTRLGVALRGVNMELYTASSRGVALDLGLVRIHGKRFTVGLSLLNFGFMSPLREASPRLPVRLLGGVAYHLQAGTLRNDFTVSGEWSAAVSGAVFRVGNELHWNHLLIQTGSEFSTRVVRLSGGVGVQIGRYQIQYGVQVGSQQVGLPQMVDLTVQLP